MNPAPKPRSASVPRHGLFTIRRVDGPDRASGGHFSKNPFYFFEINPRSTSQYILQKTPQIISKSTRSPDRMAPGFLQRRPYLYRKSTRVPETLSIIFAKNSSDFSQINIQPTSDYISFFPKKN